MITTIAISPMRLDFNNKKIRLDRKWPRAMYGWQKYEEEKVKYVKKVTEEQEPEALPQITRIYWVDADGKEILNLPDQGVATLCAMTKNISDGDTVQFEVELSEGNSMNVSGAVDSNGLIEIPNIDLGSEK